MDGMSDAEIHIRATRERRQAVLEEFEKGRYMVVGDLAIKAVEQAIEVVAALDGKHFNSHPRSAHAGRLRWIRGRFPLVYKDVVELWGAYGALGYEGIDGERAKRVVEAMERVLGEVERATGVRFR